jgi:hypothetical protein
MSRRKRCWTGGANQLVFPAGVNDTSMSAPSRLSLAQGGDYESLHAGQHGGAAISLANSAPPGYTGMLDDSLRMTARIGVLDQSMSAIKGMSDQSGGRRRRRGKKTSRRGKKGSRRSGRSSRRKQRGGAFSMAHVGDVAAPGMLLSPQQEAQALRGMNPEWKLATDPNSFTPLK